MNALNLIWTPNKYKGVVETRDVECARAHAAFAGPRSMKALVLLLVMAAFWTSAVQAANRAGEIRTLRGTASAVSATGVERSLEKGGEVFAGDRVDTGPRSFLLVEFEDSTRFALGQNSSLNINDFVYNSESKPDNIATQVLKGAFRFVSGLISKRRPEAMRVRLGVVATIGLRGTNVGGTVDGDSAVVVLLEPETEGATTGIDVSNQFGEVSISEPGYGTEIPDANSPPSPPRRMRLRTVENIMRSLQSIGRVSTPRPRGGGYMR